LNQLASSRCEPLQVADGISEVRRLKTLRIQSVDKGYKDMVFTGIPYLVGLNSTRVLQQGHLEPTWPTHSSTFHSLKDFLLSSVPQLLTETVPTCHDRDPVYGDEWFKGVIDLLEAINRTVVNDAWDILVCLFPSSSNNNIQISIPAAR